MTFAEFLQPTTLDPANPVDARGVIGGIEMAAMYDTLIQYDPQTGKFVPRVAQSLTSNADASEWTLKLRSGIKFDNGDPLNAQAVKASIQRHLDPKLASAEKAFASNIADMQTPDDLTVVFRLTGPWGGFPWFLSVGGGMITDANVVAQLGANFANLPKGAGVGPYEITSFTPGESIELQAKKDYWGGPVCIQTLKFVHFAGGAATYQSLQTGGADVGFLRDPGTIAQARKDKMPVLSTLYSLGIDLEMNQRPNAPAADQRVRQAITLAVDPEEMDRRYSNGTGHPSSAIIADNSRWYQGLKGPQFDPAKAKQILQQVVAEGKFDGNLKLISLNDPASQAAALSVQAQLQAVGFKISTAFMPAVAQARVAGSYDLVVTGVNVSEASPYIGLTQFTTTGRNASHYSNPQFDAAVGQLKAATDDASTKAALKDLQDLWNQTYPAATLASSEEVIAHSAKVKGLVLGEESLVYFDKAYLSP